MFQKISQDTGNRTLAVISKREVIKRFAYVQLVLVVYLALSIFLYADVI